MTICIIGIGFHTYGQKYNFKVFDVENNLYIPRISSMSSGNYGYLFFGGKETVYRFDGKSAEAIDPNYKIPFTEIKEIYEDSSDQITYLANNQLMKFGAPEPLINEAITTYAISGKLLFFGGKNGIKIFDKERNFIDRPEALTQLETLEINDLLIDRNFLLIASNAGLFRYNISSESIEDFSTTENYDIQKLLKEGSNNVWSYDEQGTILKIDLQSKETISFQNRGSQFVDLAIDSSQRIWFGSVDEGILIYNTIQDRWNTIDQRSGLQDNRISDILVDLWGSVWIATADNSLSKYIDLDYELFNVYDGLESDEVTTLFPYDDRLFFATGNKGVFSFDNRNFKSVYDLEVKSEAIFVDSNDLWIGTNGGGLINVKNGESTVFRKNNGLPSNWVNKVTKDRNGQLWIATPSNGLAKLAQRDSLETNIINFGPKEGLNDLNITALLAHSDGSVYYGTQSGKIGFIRNGRHSSITSAYIRSEISDILEGEKGALYFSSLGHGITKLTNQKNFVEEQIDGYPESVKAIILRGGKLWAVNDKGITDGSQYYFASDGFPSNKITKSEMIYHNNRTWIASMDGLLSLGDLVKNKIEKKPKIYFESVQLGYDRTPSLSLVIEGQVSIDYNQNQINFEYQGVDIHSNKDLTYSYLLEGRDKEWSSWSKNDNISLNNLAPGSYNFRVRARSDDESISDPISRQFVVEGPIWKEWWFIPSLLLGFGLIVYLIFRQRLRVIRKKNAEEKAKLELKNKLLELEQKANQLQMNPHFIFNALNSIQATVAKEDYTDARKEISDFATLMRSILSNSKERVISLQDELLLLRKYVAIERKSRSLDFDYQVNIDPKMNEEEVLIPPMIIQPFIENAIIHGLAKKKNGKLVLSLDLIRESLVEVKISDNGIGYEHSKLAKKMSNHKSIAIDVTKERLEALLDKKDLPAVTIQQTNDEGGTEVQLKIPIEYNF